MDIKKNKTGLSDWDEYRLNNPKEATIGASVVGGVSGVTGIAAVTSGIKQLITGDGVIRPVLKIAVGLVSSLLSIISFSEVEKLVNGDVIVTVVDDKIEDDSKSEKEKENDDV